MDGRSWLFFFRKVVMQIGQLILGLVTLALAKGPAVTDRVIFSITQGKDVLGEITIDLFGKTVPKTGKHMPYAS